MGQLFAFFRYMGQRCGCPSDQQDTQPISMETVGTSRIHDSTFTNPEIVHSFQNAVSTTDPGNTSTGGGLKLTDSQIEGLAREMEATKMASIVIADLQIGVDTVNNFRLVRQGDYVGFNRDLLVLWRNKNQGINQIQVSWKITISYLLLQLTN